MIEKANPLSDMFPQKTAQMIGCSLIGDAYDLGLYFDSDWS